MKVFELIDKLKTFNPDANISLTSSEDICLSYIFKNINGEDYTKKDTLQVFIEPTDECSTCIHEYTTDGERLCSYYEKPCKNVEECYQYEEFNDE